MTEVKLSEELITIMEYISEKAGIIVDWTSKDILPLLQEICKKYISWEIATSIVWLIVGIFIIVVDVVLTRMIYKNLMKAYGELDTEDISVLCVINIILGLTSIWIIGTEIFDIIKCSVFPELQIYEYIKKLKI